MIIDSTRIFLRSWEDGDIDDLLEGLNNINVSKWLGAIPYPYTRQDAEDFVYYATNIAPKQGNIMLAIVLKENNRVIGGTSIESINKRNGTANGWIWLNEKYQKNGYGTEAFSARIKYAFEELGLRRIECGYFPGNVQSEKMQKKLGFKDEGIRRKRFWCLSTNEYVDEHATGLLKEEFTEFNIH